MKKGSSGNRRSPPRPPQAPASRYPTRDNVYSLQQERMRKEQMEAQRLRNQGRYQQSYRPQEPQPAPRKKNRRRKNNDTRYY